MQALNAQFEFFDVARVPADQSGTRQGSALTRRVRVRKYKNRGNEAKKYLKTKEVTFWNVANDAHFRRQFAHIECWKEQRTAQQDGAGTAGSRRDARQRQLVGYTSYRFDGPCGAASSRARERERRPRSRIAGGWRIENTGWVAPGPVCSRRSRPFFCCYRHLHLFGVK